MDLPLFRGEVERARGGNEKGGEGTWRRGAGREGWEVDFDTQLEQDCQLAKAALGGIT